MLVLRKKRKSGRIRGGALLPALLFLLFALLIPSAGRAAAVKDVVVSNSSHDLLLYFTVSDAFTPEMEAGVQNGIPAIFTYFINLFQVRQGLSEEEVVSLSFDYTLKYDNLKEKYRVDCQQPGCTAMTADSLEQAKLLMTEVNGVVVAPLDKLDSPGDYRLEVKAKLSKKTLPLNFQYLIPFWRLWDFETEWQVVEFSY